MTLLERSFLAVVLYAALADGFSMLRAPAMPSSRPFLSSARRRSGCGSGSCAGLTWVCRANGGVGDEGSEIQEPAPSEQRRNLLKSALYAGGGICCQTLVPAAAATSASTVPPPPGGWVELPSGQGVRGRLQRCGSSYCVTYLVDGSPFKGVVDTGSPFLTITGSCSVIGPALLPPLAASRCLLYAWCESDVRLSFFPQRLALSRIPCWPRSRHAAGHQSFPECLATFPIFGQSLSLSLSLSLYISHTHTHYNGFNHFLDRHAPFLSLGSLSTLTNNLGVSLSPGSPT
jgi:hypothetical protein